MPIWLRNFTFNKLKEYYAKQDQPKKQSSTKAKGPDIDPTYYSKASTK
jgi:hypothetical protein